jgi:hypothetical protein
MMLQPRRLYPSTWRHFSFHNYTPTCMYHDWYPCIHQAEPYARRTWLFDFQTEVASHCGIQIYYMQQVDSTKLNEVKLIWKKVVKRKTKGPMVYVQKKNVQWYQKGRNCTQYCYINFFTFQVINISDLPFDTKLYCKAFSLVITIFILLIITFYPTIYNLTIILYFHLIDASNLYVLQL